MLNLTVLLCLVMSPKAQTVARAHVALNPFECEMYVSVCVLHVHANLCGLFFFKNDDEQTETTTPVMLPDASVTCQV